MGILFQDFQFILPQREREKETDLHIDMKQQLNLNFDQNLKFSKLILPVV
jgi:hypothetical protein